MPIPTYFLVHVTDPVTSAAFYGDVLGRAPVEVSPTFVLFVLDGGIKVGLWAKESVVPASGGAPGALEIGIPFATPAAVDAAHAASVARGHAVLQAPTDVDFGRSAMIADPDGHRIRLFAVND